MDDIIDILKDKCMDEFIIRNAHCSLHADDTLMSLDYKQFIHNNNNNNNNNIYFRLKIKRKAYACRYRLSKLSFKWCIVHPLLPFVVQFIFERVHRCC